MDATIRQSVNVGFDSAILRSARRWKYRPAMKDGVPVRYLKTLAPGSVSDEDPMYERFYGFREAPFELTSNPRFLFFTAQHREALCNLEYGLSAAKPVTVLIGDAGTGKSTLLRAALDVGGVPPRHVRLHRQPDADARRVFRDAGLAIRARTRDAEKSKATLLAQLEAMIRSRQSRGEITALVIDEAQALPDEILEEIRLLANMETPTGKLLPVVLAGQPELAVRLNEPRLRQLKQRIALRCELKPLSLHGHGGLHRLAHPDGGRRSREHLHARGGDADSRVLARPAADDQRDVRQRADVGICARSAGRRRHRARSVSRFRFGSGARSAASAQAAASGAGHTDGAEPESGSKLADAQAKGGQPPDDIEPRTASLLGIR